MPPERSYLSHLVWPDDRQCWEHVNRMRALLRLGEANRARLVTPCPPAVRARLAQKVSVSLRDTLTRESPGHEHFMVTRVGRKDVGPTSMSTGGELNRQSADHSLAQGGSARTLLRCPTINYALRCVHPISSRGNRKTYAPPTEPASISTRYVVE